MRTRPLPAHSGADAHSAPSRHPRPLPTLPTRRRPTGRQVDRAELEHDWSRRRAPAAFAAAAPDLPADPAADDLVRSRLAAERAAALRLPADQTGITPVGD